jgi:hypothetical protein
MFSAGMKTNIFLQYLAYLVFIVVSRAYSIEEMNVINGYVTLVPFSTDTFKYNLKEEI